MQFQGFDWLDGHVLWVIIPCPRNSDHQIVFWLFLQSEISKIQKYFLIVFNKTIIPLTLVEYEMITNSALRASLTIISYPKSEGWTISHLLTKGITIR